MRIVVKNFQSIESTKLDIKGFTVITGKSNLGKTALLRAVNAALFGLPGDYYIRDGTDQCGVAMADGADFLLKWLKVRAGKAQPGRETSLEVNGTKHTKMNREHSVLTEPLGVKEIKTTATKSRPQIAMQHDNIFLLTDSETTVAEVLRMLGRADVVTEAQRSAKKDLREVETRLKIRTEDEKAARKNFEETEHVPELRRELNQLQKTVEKTLEEVKKKELILTTTGNLRRIELRPQPVPPKITTPAQQLTTIQKIQRLRLLRPKTLPNPVKLEMPNQPVLLQKLKRLQLLAPRTMPTVPTVSQEAIHLLQLKLNKVYVLKETKKEEETWAEYRKETSDLLEKTKREKKEAEEILKICPTCERSF